MNKRGKHGRCAVGYLQLQPVPRAPIEPPNEATVRERLARQLEEIVRRWEPMLRSQKP